MRLPWTKRHIVGIVVGLGLLVLLHWLPPIDPITSVGMTRLGVLSFAVVWWIFAPVSLTVTTIAALTLGVLLGGIDYQNAFGGETMWILWFVVGAFGLSAALESTGFNRRFALFFLNQPFVSGRPFAFVVVFLLSAVLLSGFMANTVVAVLWLAIADSMYSFLGLERGDQFAEVNTLGLAWAANIGGVTTPVGNGANPVAIAIIAGTTGYTIGFLTWTIVGYFASLMLLGTALLVFRYVVRPDLSSVRDPKTTVFLQKEKRKIGPMSNSEKWALFWFGTAVVLWFMPGVLDFVISEEVGEYLDENIGLVVPALLAPTAMCLTPVEDSDRATVFSWGEWAEGVDWGLVIFIAGVLALGTSLGSEDSGIPQLLETQFQPLLGGMPEYLFVFLLTLTVGLVTSAISNMVSISIFLPLSLTLSQGLGIGSPLAIGLVVTMATSLSYALPSGTSTTALVAGSGWLRVQTMIKYGLFLNLVHAAVLTGLVYSLAKVLLP